MPHVKTKLTASRYEPGRSGRPATFAGLAWKARIAVTTVRNFLLRCTGHLPTNALRVGIYRRLFRMRIGRGARLDTNCVIWGPSRITIGSGSVINRSVLLDGRMPLKIGDNSSISLEVMILTLQHDLAAPDFDSEGSPVEIGDRVFVGARAVILPGIIIGDGAAVAAGAVVTKDVAPYTIVGGNPARPIGTRPRDLRYRLDRL